MSSALSTIQERREKVAALCQGKAAGARIHVPLYPLSSEVRGAPWAWPRASQMWSMLWGCGPSGMEPCVPETPPGLGLCCVLLSLPAHHIPQACREPAAPAEPLPIPQVTDKLQEMLTTSCSLKTTIEAFQEELQLLKDNFQKVRAQSWPGAGGPSAEGL